MKICLLSHCQDTDILVHPLSSETFVTPRTSEMYRGKGPQYHRQIAVSHREYSLVTHIDRPLKFRKRLSDTL